MAAESATAPPSAVGEGGGGEDLDVSTQILREQARERSDVIRTDIERLFRDIRAYNDGEEMPVRRTEKQLLETIAEALARAIADGAMAAEVAPKSLGFFKCIIGRNIEAAMEDAIPGEFNCDQKTRRSGNVPDLRVRWAEDFGAETKAVCINDGVVADKIGKMLFAHVITLAVSHLRTQRIVADRIEDWPVANVDPSHHGTQAAPEKSGGAARPPKSGKVRSFFCKNF